MGRKPDSRLEAARQRMIDADRVKVERPETWDAWQQAAADYWVLRHPEQADGRRPVLSHRPTIEEMQRRAIWIQRALADVPSGWRLMPGSDARTEYLAQVGWFHELMSGLYDPVWRAVGQIRSGDAAGLETLIRFLEADVYCHRSGYAKADVIRFLTRVSLPDAAATRLRAVVLQVVDAYDRREFRSYIRLAKAVDDDRLRAALVARTSDRSPNTARRARWVLIGLGVALPEEVPPVER